MNNINDHLDYISKQIEYYVRTIIYIQLIQLIKYY